MIASYGTTKNGRKMFQLFASLLFISILFILFVFLFIILFLLLFTLFNHYNKSLHCILSIPESDWRNRVNSLVNRIYHANRAIYWWPIFLLAHYHHLKLFTCLRLVYLHHLSLSLSFCNLNKHKFTLSVCSWSCSRSAQTTKKETKQNIT